MTQTAIPCLFMRGGTSRGLYFARADLPADRETLSAVLLAALGAGHPLCIDGMGGSESVTTKVAMLSRSEEEGTDVDFFFAQISGNERSVDYAPTCGNILVGVGPAAIEMGLKAPDGEATSVDILATNTGARITEVVTTLDGKVVYDGDTAIAGVPGTAAPVLVKFRGVTGGKTGAMFPTGRTVEEIDGIPVTLIDVAMPMMIARAESFGLTGYETKAELDANAAFFARMEPMRREAGRRMGLGDVAGKVVPKVGLLAPPRGPAHLSSRYFVPDACHPSHAVSGAICTAACLLSPGTVAEGLGPPPPPSPATIRIEHVMGTMELAMEYGHDPAGALIVDSAGVIRTARLIMRGEVMVPRRVWDGCR
ncbi:PrpF domain-containing protein [Rhodobium gokarnense]|uniref:2-methylaconitate cis-trans-isomerase PrpF n=1 Tax=Rhodobium gokarnense TaxID=364296 RepID=A0ABT3H7W6_9HYPH|nr:PrpF domain-containing protein [Rhodobium gokarnense]MCW2306492.1 2-methylaconitate cis-trans-isomerase PrpF [Rhodobium gokarnense]